MGNFDWEKHSRAPDHAGVNAMQLHEVIEQRYTSNDAATKSLCRSSVNKNITSISPHVLS